MVELNWRARLKRGENEPDALISLDEIYFWRATNPWIGLNGKYLFFVVFNQIRRHRLGLSVIIVIDNRVHDRQTQRMLLRNVRNVVSGGINRVAFVFFVPVGEVSGLVHVLDDLPPADAGVVSAE